MAYSRSMQCTLSVRGGFFGRGCFSRVREAPQAHRSLSVAFQVFYFLPAGAEYQNAVGFILVGYVDRQNLLVKMCLLL